MSAALHRRAARRTVGQDCQKCKETYLLDQGKKKNGIDTSSPIADKQQKMGEHVENIQFS